MYEDLDFCGKNPKTVAKFVIQNQNFKRLLKTLICLKITTANIHKKGKMCNGCKLSKNALLLLPDFCIDNHKTESTFVMQNQNFQKVIENIDLFKDCTNFSIKNKSAMVANIKNALL